MIITFYFRWIMHETSAWEHSAAVRIPVAERLDSKHVLRLHVNDRTMHVER
jgi:hypothetical protein